MDPSVYEEMLVQENVHWWFLARKKIVSHILKNLKLPPQSAILDAGCGSGGNLSVLSQLNGNLYAFEMYDQARNHAKSLGLATIEPGHLPDAIPFPGVTFDLIALLDVLEHIENDNAALKALVARLKPGGVMCINVPACQWLFARHDRLHHHFRRYSKKDMVRMIEAAGLRMDYVTFWNFLLFPAAIVARLIDCFGFTRDQAIGAHIPPAPVNKLLMAIVSSERFIMPRLSLPCGLSLLLLARKPS